MKTKKPSERVAPTDLLQIYESILAKNFKLSQISEEALTSRNLNFWMNEGLLLFVRYQDNTWSKYNFIDYVWIKLLLYMHDMDMGKKGKITSIKQCLALLPDNIIPNLSADSVKILQNADGSTNALMTTLTNLVAADLWEKTQIYIRLYKGGACHFIRDQDIIASHPGNGSMAVPSDEDTAETYIQIALKDIYVDFAYRMIISEKVKEPTRVGLLTNQEGVLLEQIDKGLVTEIEVQLQSANPIFLSLQQGNKPEVANILSKHLVQSDYTKITYGMADGGSTTISKTKHPINTLD